MSATTVEGDPEVSVTVDHGQVDHGQVDHGQKVGAARADAPTAAHAAGTGVGTGVGTAVGTGSTDIAAMRVEIDAIDAELVRLIQRRTDLSKAIGALRASEGGPRIVYSREMRVLERFAALGTAGTDLGMLLLSMGRGRLGRR